MSDMQEIKGIVASAVSLGISLYSKVREPQSDNISIREAVRYLRHNGAVGSARIISEWVSMGKLKVRHKGEGGRGYISFVELQTLVLESKIHTLLTIKT